jgi:MFS family permease
MTKRSLAVLFACFATVLIAYSIRYSYGTLLPEMLSSLNITKAGAGIIYSSYFIAYTILSPILGIMADKFNMRYLLAGFVTLMGIGTFLMQYPSSVLQASLFFTVAGIGCAACWAPVMALAQRWINDKRRGMNLSLIDAGSSLGVMAAGGLVPLAAANFSWQAGWMILGLAGIILGAANLFLIRDYPVSKDNLLAAIIPAKVKKAGISYNKILRDKRFWFIGLAYLLTGFAIIIPFTFLTTFAVRELSFPYSSATLLITVIGVGGITGKLTLGPFSDKIGRIKIMMLCAVLIAGGCLAMIYSRGWILVAVCFFYGIGYGACWAMYAACASDFFSKESAGGIIGIWTLLMGLGSIIAPVVSGWVGDLTGTLMWSFVIAMAGGWGSLILLLPLFYKRQSYLSRNV